MHDFKSLYWNYPRNWIVCILQQENKPGIANTPGGLLAVVTDNTTHFSLKSISVVIKDEIVVSDLLTLTHAIVHLFGLICALHLE